MVIIFILFEFTGTVNKCHKTRYTSSILRTATENYLEAQKLNVNSEKMKVDALNKINDMLIQYVDVCRSRNDTEQLKVDNERKKSKMKYYEIFGTINGFDEF